MAMKSFFTLLLFTVCTRALTDEELALFKDSDYVVNVNTANGGSFQSKVSVSLGTDTITISSNSIPNHDTTCATGNNRPGDNCYGPIPANVDEVNFSVTVPRYPALNPEGSTTCTGNKVGMAINGVQYADPYTGVCGDAMESEFVEGNLDVCQGHPFPNNGGYHYHGWSDCIYPGVGADVHKAGQEPRLVGVAYDGFPIYTAQDPDKEGFPFLSNAELDECHGIMTCSGYRYIVNFEEPYVVGCFKGTPINAGFDFCSQNKQCDIALGGGGGGMGPPQGGNGNGPPQGGNGNGPPAGDFCYSSIPPPNIKMACHDITDETTCENTQDCAFGTPPGPPPGGRRLMGVRTDGVQCPNGDVDGQPLVDCTTLSKDECSSANHCTYTLAPAKGCVSHEDKAEYEAMYFSDPCYAEYGGQTGPLVTIGIGRGFQYHKNKAGKKQFKKVCKSLKYTVDGKRYKCKAQKNKQKQMICWTNKAALPSM